MYTLERAQTRFDVPAPNAERFVCVQYSVSAGWVHLSDLGAKSFVPVATDLLVAAVDFDLDVATLIRASRADSVQGVAAGVLRGDLEVLPDVFDGNEDSGEFSLQGTSAHSVQGSKYF
jgi:hypothetical protein